MLTGLLLMGTTLQCSLFDLTAEAEPTDTEIQQAVESVAPYRCLDPNCDGFVAVSYPGGVRTLFCDEKTCVHHAGTRLEELP